MNNINPDAQNHPCMKCEYGDYWTEQGKPAGNICLHPDVLKMRGLYYGRYHTLKTVPKWCARKEKKGD